MKFIFFIYQQSQLLLSAEEMDLNISHPDDPSIELIHCIMLIKKIVAVYVSIRLKHYCKLYRHLHLDKNIRKNMSKIILFKNQ